MSILTRWKPQSHQASRQETVAMLAAVLALVFAAACADAADTPGVVEPAAEPPPGLASASFVGRQVCAECHAAVDERWRGSHHDLAMQEARPDTVLGDFDDALFEHEGVTTRFGRDGDELHVSAEGPDGEQTDYAIAYTFGVEPLQQYLIAFPDGRYQALDVAWDSRPAADGGQRWFHLRPGERNPPGDPLHWTGVAYNWNNMCADCHSTDVRKNYDAGADSYRTTFAEVDVSCEACHGPGSAHRDWAVARAPDAGESGAPPAAPDTAAEATGAAPLTADEAAARAASMGLQVGFPPMAATNWIINDDTGLARRQPEDAPAADVESCGRCHARRGQVDEGYRFGGPIGDFYRVALLEDGLYHPDGQIDDEVFVYGSFRQSRMYQAGVACADCHDPHSLQPYADGNALCNRCHAGPRFDTPEHHHHEVGTDGASCVACHMPATTYMVVDPRRDHSFRVPRPDLSAQYGTPNACADCHADRGDRWAADAIELWFGPQRPASFGARLAIGRGNEPGSADELLMLARDGEAPAIVRASALSLLPAVGPGSINALGAGLEDEDPLVRRGALTALDGGDPATLVRLVLPLLADPDRSVRLEAARLMAAVPSPSIPPASRGAVAAAIEEFRAAQQFNEDRAQAHLNLGWLALQQNDPALAEQEYRAALRLEPMFVPALINLADLYRLSGRDDEGEQLLRRAIEIAPESGDAYHALGLLLVRRGRPDEAADALRRAAVLSPGNPRYLYVHAVAVQSGGDVDGALRILDDGLERFPADPELLFAAASFSAQDNQVERAIGYARRLVEARPGDPQAAALLQELEARR